jgi:recombinational DNA repair ATPase RecF
MHITRIELDDIKSYVNAAFDFERGTTAIMGENGAGKTTLIEAGRMDVIRRSRLPKGRFCAPRS